MFQTVVRYYLNCTLTESFWLLCWEYGEGVLRGEAGGRMEEAVARNQANDDGGDGGPHSAGGEKWSLHMSQK